jgi:ribosomal protein L12E/L44/L45/RPP1/RPP2
MMTIAIDPAKQPARNVRLPAILRASALACAGIAGLAGLSAGAYWMLSGLAGPPPRQIRIASVASEWPDLKDGLPALAPTIAATPPRNAEPVAVAKSSTDVASSTDIKASAETPKARALAPLVRLPNIEPAALLPPVRIAVTVPPARVAALVAPLSGETVRARAAETAFAALPPAPSPRPKANAAPRVKAEAQPAVTPAVAQEAEPEHTEVFGLKVPSLAPAGRKIAESVEALGNAVKNAF